MSTQVNPVVAQPQAATDDEIGVTLETIPAEPKTPAPVEPAKPATSEPAATQAQDGAVVTPTPAESVVPETPEQAEKSAVQKRIDSLTRRRYQLETRNEALEEELAMSRRQLAELQQRVPQPVPGQPLPPAAIDPNEPTRDKFESYEDYVRALSGYTVRKEIAVREAQYTQSQVQAGQNAVVQNWNTNINAARTKYADFDEVVGVDLKIPQSVFTAIIDSPVGADIAYHLGTHPEEAVKFSRMSPLGAVRELGRIESKFLSASTPANPVGQVNAPSNPALSQAVPAPKPKPTTHASAPVVPVGGSSTAALRSVRDENISYQDFKAIRDAEEAARRARR